MKHEHNMTDDQIVAARQELERAVSLIGSKTEAARALEITRPTLYSYLDSGVCPALVAKRLEEITQVSRAIMRPDVFGDDT